MNFAFKFLFNIKFKLVSELNFSALVENKLRPFQENEVVKNLQGLWCGLVVCLCSVSNAFWRDVKGLKGPECGLVKKTFLKTFHFRLSFAPGLGVVFHCWHNDPSDNIPSEWFSDGGETEARFSPDSQRLNATIII